MLRIILKFSITIIYLNIHALIGHVDVISDQGPLELKDYSFTGKVLGKGSFGLAVEILSTKNERFALKVQDDNDMAQAENKILEDLCVQRNIFRNKCEQTLPFTMWQVEGYQCSEKKFCNILEMAELGDLEEVYFSPKKNKGLITGSEVKKVLAQLLTGLYFLHSKGIVHRDIKPANIFLKKDDTILIGDYGIAHTVSAKNERLGGTLNYMPPEVLLRMMRKGDTADTKYTVKDFHKVRAPVQTASDIWAAGVTAYVLCYGTIPFRVVEGKSIVLNDMYKHVKYNNLGILPADNACSKEWPQAASVISGLLHANPEQRLTARGALKAMGTSAKIVSCKYLNLSLCQSQQVSRRNQRVNKDRAHKNQRVQKVNHVQNENRVHKDNRQHGRKRIQV